MARSFLQGYGFQLGVVFVTAAACPCPWSCPAVGCGVNVPLFFVGIRIRERGGVLSSATVLHCYAAVRVNRWNRVPLWTKWK